MKHKNSKTAGFSLIELVIAMTFLTIVVFGVVSLQSSNLAMINRQNNQIQAHFYANQGVQIVKAIGSKQITACSSCYLYFSNKNYSLKSSSSGKETIDDKFERYFEIESTNLTGAYKVTSIVEWEDGTGKHTAKEGGAVEAKLIISK